MRVRSRSRSVGRSAVAVVVVLGFAGCLGGLGAVAEPPEAPDGTLDSPSADATDGNLSIHFLHVGQGASVLVVGPSGETLLYDTGNWNDDGEYVLDYLRERGVSRIDYLVTSHADADHVGGHAAVIDYYEREAGGVGAVYDPGIAAATRTYEEYLDAVEEHDVTLYRTQAGDSIPLTGASVDVLAPPEGYLSGEDRNENSVVLRVERGDASLLLTGDAEGSGERYLLDRTASRLNVTVLAAGHHGSNTSTGPGLLDASQPRAVVIQSAVDSPYGHPHRELLERLADRSIPTYWTGVHGSVVFDTDGDRFAVWTQREATTDPLELRRAPGVTPGATDSLERRGTFGVGERPGLSPSGTIVADGGPETVGPTEALELVAVRADAAGDDRENLNDEYLVFRNAGDEPLDLSGWTVSDEADHRYAFPDGTELDPGATLTLYTGSGSGGSGDYYWGSRRPIWNNAGDTVFVRTAEGQLVLEETYDG